jgi:hypothetical protein
MACSTWRVLQWIISYWLLQYHTLVLTRSKWPRFLHLWWHNGGDTLGMLVSRCLLNANDYFMRPMDYYLSHKLRFVCRISENINTTSPVILSNMCSCDRVKITLCELTIVRKYLVQQSNKSHGKHTINMTFAHCGSWLYFIFFRLVMSMLIIRLQTNYK